MRGGTTGLASASLLSGVHRLAELACTQPEVERALRTESPEDVVKRLQDLDPDFATAFWKVIADAGHRGPGETELANLMYGDKPAQLIGVVRMALDGERRHVSNPVQLSGIPGRSVSALNAAVRRRERSKDVAMRATHALRSALRETGRRHVEAGVFDQVDDVFYLTPEEVASPALHVDRIAGRRAERLRLSALSLPPTFTLHWEPLSAAHPAAGAGAALRGVGASPGVVRGPVCVVHSADDLDDLDDLAPDTVLVVRVTDVGWTPLFGCVAAVVTDVGGLHSHAAIVAREFGVPCVVGTERATLDLRDGVVVEVDGTRGTVTRV